MRKAGCILDMYRTGELQRESLWDKKERKGPLPYANCSRNVNISLERTSADQQQQGQQRSERTLRNSGERKHTAGDIPDVVGEDSDSGSSRTESHPASDSANDTINEQIGGLLTAVQLSQLNKLLALQNPNAANSGKISQSGTQHAISAQNPRESNSIFCDDKDKIIISDFKTRIEFPRFALLPAEGDYLPDLYPYTCFLGEIVEPRAPCLIVKDIRGEAHPVVFDRDTEFGSFAVSPETFRWGDLTIGRTIAILKAKTKLVPTTGKKSIIIDKTKLSSLFVFDENLANVCNTVLKLGNRQGACFLSSCSETLNLQPCTNCHLAHYCCEDHQRKSWFSEGHERICYQAQVLQKLTSSNFRGIQEFDFLQIINS